MSKLKLLLLVVLAALQYVKAQTVLSQDPIYHLVFEDEFDSLGLRPSNWNPIWGWGPNIVNGNVDHASCGDVEAAYNYSPLNNITNRRYDTSGTGSHRLISRHESPPIQGNVFVYDSVGHYTGTQSIPFNFTTAMLFGRHHFKYAYVEMSFRTSPFDYDSPYNAYAPNLWMWWSDSTAIYSEIDISEMQGRTWTTAPCSHYKHFNHLSDTGNAVPPPSGFTADDTLFWHGNSFWPNHYSPNLRRHSVRFTPGQWHTIGCEWTPEYIDTYYYTQSADTFQRFPVSNYPVDKLTAMPIVIDNYTPAIRDSFCIFYDSVHTQLPFNYDIDYVRVWQVRQNCTSVNFLNIASAGTYTSTLYNDLTIGGSGSTGCYFSSGNSHLAANDFVLLKEGFEISGSNTTVLVNIMKCQAGQSMNYNSSTAPSSPPDFERKRDFNLKRRP